MQQIIKTTSAEAPPDCSDELDCNGWLVCRLASAINAIAPLFVCQNRVKAVNAEYRNAAKPADSLMLARNRQRHW
jgi:hypothetical protein